jgi:hypothetical protein
VLDGPGILGAEADADHAMLPHLAHPPEQVACVVDTAITHEVGD